MNAAIRSQTRLRQAVVLAGGLGTRMRPLTDRVPKPMITLLGKPFLAYLLDDLKRNGFEEVVLLLGYLPERVIEYFNEHPIEGLVLRYHVGEVDWNTGTRVRRARQWYDETFLLLYSDNYWPLDVTKHVAAFELHEADWLVTSFKTDRDSAKGNLVVDELGKVVAYDSTKTDPRRNGVDIGFFVLKRSVVDRMPDVDFHLTNEFLPREIERGKVYAYQTGQVYYSIGSLDRLPLTERYLAPKKVVFLDRDGVINVKAPRADYVKSFSEFQFLDGVLEALRTWRAHGYKVVVVSNQAGIARGVMSHSDLEDVHERMKAAIREAGGEIEAIYVCPHGWDEGCSCRKPQPGMLFRASKDFDVELRRCLFIGDDERDVEAGTAAGIPTALVGPRRSLLHVTQQFFRRGLNYMSAFESLWFALSKRQDGPFAVAIGGPSRAGKSTLAQAFAEDLRSVGKTVFVLELDRFLKGVDERDTADTVRERYRYSEIVEALRALMRGETIDLPVYDVATRKRVSCVEETNLAGVDVLLVEGVVALDVAAAQAMFASRIYVEADPSVRRHRSVEFMTRIKGIERAAALKIFDEREEDEVSLIRDGRWNADVLFRWDDGIERSEK